MNVSLKDAHEQLMDLVSRAEAGEDIVLTRDGRPAVRIVPIPCVAKTLEDRRQLIEDIWSKAKAERLAAGLPDNTAAASQDFLYDEAGLPV